MHAPNSTLEHHLFAESSAPFTSCLPIRRGAEPHRLPSRAHPGTDVAADTLRTTPPRARDRVYALGALALAVLLLLPVAFIRRPGHARALACRWALALRFPTQDLTGLTPAARHAFDAARTEAFWRHRRLIGVTSGYRDPATQQQLFDVEVRRSGSVAAARTLVLPPAESSHVRGIALDVRPCEGARWLEEHGGRFDLYRTYDNEWWHFEHRPETAGIPPLRKPHPGAAQQMNPNAETRAIAA
ncbi:D,D-peptidase/D,D-carboxypeptidase VanY-N [Nocardia sp. CDC153]|uniref:D,D-peptidase/D,D-carboxypeptidase VanY-N n=1 Tax=Nocardia sp. CDC153 TaxID=3112167 RepID=UPI002DBAC946|nr:D,D-peptidase/D,D-carboxypeptidase VanY-N [Nocardia sp. CDC153]MEC3953263.1 D,D-peptidase/D,D-carboxypeptidase VanY-N [Nocardia sp. CDC153]